MKNNYPDRPDLSVFDQFKLGDVPDALLLADRPGAAALFLTIDGLIRECRIPDDEMAKLAAMLLKGRSEAP